MIQGCRVGYAFLYFVAVQDNANKSHFLTILLTAGHYGVVKTLLELSCHPSLQVSQTEFHHIETKYRVHTEDVSSYLELIT
jgi:hypothetical protein